MDAPAETLAPWLAAQLSTLLAQRGHARLLLGPPGLGQYTLALALARAWLCESPLETGAACGVCTSCHAIDVHAHGDLCMLLPEVDMLRLGWPLPEKDQADLDDKKRKPSKEIRVEALRDALQFSQRTSGRGHGKVVLVYPAERMNAIAANTLLKTLEEPPGDLKFVLASEAAHQLLPTIRSRCLGHSMHWPQPEPALQWLSAQGLAPSIAAQLLRASGGRPHEALQAAHDNPQTSVTESFWSQLPRALLRGDVAPLVAFSPTQVIDVMQKICHDQMCMQVGAQPRFFEPQDLPKPPPMAALANWAKHLATSARTSEHPFNPGLMLESLVSQAQRTLNSST
jgi:DNA polymerase III subunit delta'